MKNLKKQTKNGEEDSTETPNSLSIFVGNSRFFRKGLIRSVLILSLLFFSSAGTNSSLSYDGGDKGLPVEKEDPKVAYVESINNKFYEKLISEVSKYVYSIAPETKLNPKYLVDKCLEYDTDIDFVLAQGLLESHFGTKGKAAETNSVWNVGTYDNGRVLYKYSHPDESIEPYLKLINEKYLVAITSAGDTIKKAEKTLVEDRGYININGLRFATARGYENAMRKLMIRIDNETSISFYQHILRLSSDEVLAYFLPEEGFKSEPLLAIK